MKKKKNKKQTSANIRMNQKEPSLVFYFILIALNLIATVLVSRVSASNEVIRIGNGAIPVRTISGVISSVANICLIFLVVFHNKLGFITALIIQGIQLPIMIVNIVAHNNLTAISGIFTNLFTVVAIVLIYQRNKKIDEYQIYELEYVVRQQKFSERLFEQTATALVNVIDAKDTYSHGHSVRVAEYSVKIAKRFGKEDPEELQRIYYAALLHDV
ncbi:MAG: HD domain-containing protein, partial [Lachnospiraceae bacterium]|nr:HD domain-containing protein [Lachnospiraceae bacterium]